MPQPKSAAGLGLNMIPKHINANLIYRMRLTQQQTLLITQAIFRLAGEHARIFLFGSRLNDNV